MQKKNHKYMLVLSPVLHRELKIKLAGEGQSIACFLRKAIRTYIKESMQQLPRDDVKEAKESLFWNQ